MGIDRIKMVINAFTKEFILVVTSKEDTEVHESYFESLDEWQDWEFFGLLFRIHIDYRYQEFMSVAVYREYTGEDNDTQDVTFTDFDNWINPEITIVITGEDFKANRDKYINP